MSIKILYINRDVKRCGSIKRVLGLITLFYLTVQSQVNVASHRNSQVAGTFQFLRGILFTKLITFV